MGRLYLHISQKDLSQRNAETTHVLEVARAFSSAGRSVRVVAPGVGRCESAVPFAIDYLPAVSRPRLLRLLSYEAALWLYLITRPELWARRASFYVRKGTALLAPLVLARLLRLPAVLEVNEVYPEIAVHRPLAPSVLAALQVLYSLSYRLASAIVVPVQTLADALQGMGLPRGKIHVVSNGVNTGVFHPREQTACRRALGLDESAAYVCYTGSLSAWQGVDVLLDAFGRVSKRHPSAFLILLGGGPMRSALEEQARLLGIGERVLFRGPVPFEQVPQYVAAATVCVVPVTVGTHSPVKLFEYLACKKPVIGSDLPGVREVISSYGCGWLARPGDADDWQAKIEAALACPREELEAMGEKGRQAVQRNHTWEAAGREILSLLDGRGGQQQ